MVDKAVVQGGAPGPIRRQRLVEPLTAFRAAFAVITVLPRRPVAVATVVKSVAGATAYGPEARWKTFASEGPRGPVSPFGPCRP